MFLKYSIQILKPSGKIQLILTDFLITILQGHSFSFNVIFFIFKIDTLIVEKLEISVFLKN